MTASVSSTVGGGGGQDRGNFGQGGRLYNFRRLLSRPVRLRSFR